MPSEAFATGQIITVLFFLASLLAALYFVRRHGTGLRQHFTAARRAQIVSELSLGPQERLRIVQIDNREYVIISGRNGTPAFFALPAHDARTQSLVEDGDELSNSLQAFVPTQKINVTHGAGK